MKKKSVFTLIVLLFIIASMFFLSCPFFGREAKEEKSQEEYSPPGWAVNKVGAVYIRLEGFEEMIDYDPKEEKKITYNIFYTSSLFTGLNESKKTDIAIYSSVQLSPLKLSKDIKEAEFDPNKREVFEAEEIIDMYNLIIPAGKEALSEITVTILYNITNLQTRILVPMRVRKPPTGTTSNITVPIFYTASPLIPSSNRTTISITPRQVIVNFDIIDAGGCFSALSAQRAQKIKYSTSARAADIGLSPTCTPAGEISITPGKSSSILCRIILDDQKIQELLKAGSEIYIELDMNLSYNCSMKREYTTKIIRVE